MNSKLGVFLCKQIRERVAAAPPLDQSNVNLSESKHVRLKFIPAKVTTVKLPFEDSLELVLSEREGKQAPFASADSECGKYCA